MSDETSLRQKARAAIQAGNLPDRHADRTWAGKGGGGCCSVCAEPLRADETEFELEFIAGKNRHDEVGNYHLHVRCFAAWELERQHCSGDERDISDRSASV